MTNDRFEAGLYFNVDSFLPDGSGERTRVSPIELLVGDEAVIVATLYSYKDDRPIIAPTLAYSWKCDDGSSGGGRISRASSVEFSVSSETAGSLNFRVYALDEDGKEIPGAESAYGGLLFGIEEIAPKSTAPCDLYGFWDKEIERLLGVSPTDIHADGYSGDVVYEYGIPQKNRFSMRELDKAYLNRLKENGISAPSVSALERYDLYELYLKSPGPAPTSVYISIPKNTKNASLPLKINYDPYDIHSPSLTVSAAQITVHCTHHGYELGMTEEYYSRLDKGILKNYGKANGGINSSYKNPHDSYMTYLILRDLQLLRFLADPELSSNLPSLHRVWNREFILSGMSMGGYQALCVGALAERLAKHIPDFKIAAVEANIPGFCNMAAKMSDGLVSDFFSYEPGADYFDPVHLAHLIRAEVKLMRVGLGDETCIASGIQAMFNSLDKSIKKSANYLQNSSHGYLPKPKNQKWYRIEY